MVKRNRSCKLLFGRAGKDRRVLYVASAELVGDDIVIHLSKNETFATRSLVEGVTSLLTSCSNMPRVWSYEVKDHCVPDADHNEISDGLRFIEEYKRVYGAKALADLIVRGFSHMRHDLPDQEVPGNE